MGNLPTNREMMVKRAIIEALDDLLADKSFEEVSVQDICERAQVSRTTFYRHFHDKYDLVSWTYEHYKDVLNKRGPEHEQFELSLGYLLQFMSEKRNFFMRAMRYAGQNSLIESMPEIVSAYMLDCYADAKGGVGSMTDAERDMVLYHATGQVAIIRKWLFAGCPVGPIALAEELCGFLPESLLETLV